MGLVKFILLSIKYNHKDHKVHFIRHIKRTRSSGLDSPFSLRMVCPAREDYFVTERVEDKGQKKGFLHLRNPIIVDREGIEPPTQGFSVLCSTN